MEPEAERGEACAEEEDPRRLVSASVYYRIRFVLRPAMLARHICLLPNSIRLAPGHAGAFVCYQLLLGFVFPLGGTMLVCAAPPH